MKVVILAGGMGTRLAEKTDVVPKPMVEIGGKPILWHIMQSYARYGFDDFVVALGYKGEVIKQFFLDYHRLGSDLHIDLAGGKVTDLTQNHDSDWKVTLVDTGQETMTGGRIRRLKEVLGDETFMLTYGDGVSDVNFDRLREFHRGHGRAMTLTAVHPKAHYGELVIGEDGKVESFMEKPQFKQSWINGGFMVLEPEVLDWIDGDDTVLERDPVDRAAATANLMAYQHRGFWQCMDTLRDVHYLNALWDVGDRPWAPAAAP
jgi:glucose-1-phosphate cytidylyltransferase